MAKYLVVKRVDVGWFAFAGEVLEGPANADLLIHRGFVTPVPDDYPAPVSRGLIVDPEDSGPTYKELQAQAKELGIPAKGTRDELAAAVEAAEKSKAEAEAAEAEIAAKAAAEEAAKAAEGETVTEKGPTEIPSESTEGESTDAGTASDETSETSESSDEAGDGTSSEESGS
jgi:hypothetical protein